MTDSTVLLRQVNDAKRAHPAFLNQETLRAYQVAHGISLNSAARILTQVVIAGTQIVGRAFVEAYKNVSVAAAANAGKNKTSDAVSFQTGMSIDEAEKILYIKKAGDVHAVGRDEIIKRYEHLFKANDPAQGGSFYLQSKISFVQSVLFQLPTNFRVILYDSFQMLKISLACHLIIIAMVI
ncbi:mitochondrial import inner membrane translocase subunit TIM16 [Physocladia obscura]|uniref:Mitochondrial import inner membrane translocase subunit TIM16 n=1 Tax=Physocladia obscura TaxID=109957 RepID=A0AAD5T8H3_9FUNG|nr:mitochondrial import inner membrane translocase subunit TIM16 [Physocladia obscura]